MADNPIWMPLYIKDYLSDTMHLTTEQHGAYMLLLMAAWRGGGVLPADDAQLAAIARLAPASWARHRAVLRAFFTETERGLEQKRLVAEFEHSTHIIETKRTNGRKGGRPRKEPPKEKLNETERKPTGFDSVPENGDFAKAKSKLRETQPQPQTQLHALNTVSGLAGGVPPNSVRARSPASPPGCFELQLDWKPGPDFPELLRFAGIPPDYPWEDDLGEFVLYRRATGETFNQGIWEKKLIATLKHNQAKRLQAGREPTRIDRDWSPSAECVTGLASLGIPRSFVADSVLGFVTFWREAGQAKHSWNAAFIDHVRSRWAAAPPSQPGGFESLTDTSWAAGLVLADEPEPGAPRATVHALEAAL
ncbi:MAG: DnaT-like ssDNA-binding domain-containing protein [Porticoccaceae bacterium]|jgi:uncharacterized protein YdaU (DUF1376 family)|nr:DnaT-like ssDNA-binding domain-containing protein [Porticoccaceae bacterium]